MTDQNSQFFAILTAVGEAKQANADALGVPWTFAQMGVGDANGADPIPDRSQTRLINERRRAPLNTVKVDPGNASIIIAEQIIPPEIGGWWIREIGLYDAAGDLVAVANCAPSFKPLLSQGTGKTQVVRLNLIVTSTANVQLKIDPAVVLATRDYVDSSILSALPRNKLAGSYTKVTIDERGIVQQGANPSTLAGFGITDGLKIGDVGLFAKNAPKLNTFRVIVPSGFYLAYGLTSEVVTEIPTSEAPPGSSGILSVVATTPRPDVTHYLVVQNGQDGKVVWFGQYNVFGNSLRWDRPLTLADRETLMVEIEKKALKATTLAGYGITDSYTRAQIDTALAVKAPLDSPKFIGAPEVVAVPPLDTSNRAASTQFVHEQTNAHYQLNAAGAGVFVLTNQQAMPIIYATGALTGDREIVLPLAFRKYLIGNFTTGAYKFTVRMATGTGVEVTRNCFTNVFTDTVHTRLSQTDFNSPALTGIPTTTKAAKGTVTDQVASCSFVVAEIADKAAKSTTLGGYGITDVFTKTETQQMLSEKANKATTLAGYGVTDAYTMSYLDAWFALKAAKATTLAGYGITDSYTSVQSESRLATKLSVSDLPRNTCARGLPGWWVCADTGLLRQRVAVYIGDAVNTWTGSVTWPVTFPAQADSVQITLMTAAGSVGLAVASYSGLTRTGCNLRVEEWGGLVQTGLQLIIEVEGF